MKYCICICTCAVYTHYWKELLNLMLLITEYIIYQRSKQTLLFVSLGLNTDFGAFLHKYEDYRNSSFYMKAEILTGLKEKCHGVILVIKSSVLKHALLNKYIGMEMPHQND